jgi:hypothetical protein
MEKVQKLSNSELYIEVLTKMTMNTTFFRIAMPCSVERTCRLLLLVSCFACFSNLKMEVIDTSKTSGCLQLHSLSTQITLVIHLFFGWESYLHALCCGHWHTVTLKLPCMAHCTSSFAGLQCEPLLKLPVMWNTLDLYCMQHPTQTHETGFFDGQDV